MGRGMCGSDDRGEKGWMRDRPFVFVFLIREASQPNENTDPKYSLAHAPTEPHRAANRVSNRDRY